MRTEQDLVVDTRYRILYEDESFLAIDKPAPLPVHAVGRFKEKNLLSLLKLGFPSNVYLSIVNRLDSETSGVVLVAKDSDVAGKLGLQFERREVSKEYLAILFGTPKPEGIIAIALGSKIENNNHVRIPDPAGQSAETHYEVLKSFRDYSLVKVIPKTGRTHQIRAHFAFEGHPIVGDKIYIDNRVYDRYVREGWQEDMREIVKMPRLALHASSLTMKHPKSNEKMKFQAEMPECFESFLVERKYNRNES